MRRRVNPRNAVANPPEGDSTLVAVITPRPTRFTKVTGKATAANEPRNFPRRTPERDTGRDRSRSRVPCTRSFETASNVTTMAKIGTMRYRKTAERKKRVASGVPKREPKGSSKTKTVKIGRAHV